MKKIIFSIPLLIGVMFCTMLLASPNSKNTTKEFSKELKKGNETKATASYRVVPLPQVIKNKRGYFEMNAHTEIVYPKGDVIMERNAQFLSEYLEQMTGLKLSITTKKKRNNNISIVLGYKNNNKEAYLLSVNKRGITIKGASPAAVFYGIQTLRKSTPIRSSSANPEKSIRYPAVVIEDEPRFSYRGIMLDVARHFEPVSFIKKYIDLLALHNINKFHWHLTEDQGWRIEIKKYPKLTAVGSHRTETVVGRNTDKYDGKPHGGFYTQEEIKEIVKYATDRHITIIPEIDLPGHMMAALAAYPELGCTGGPYEVQKRWGVFDDVLCVGQERTFNFLEDVLSEVMELFPSKYIHIGGDECPKTRWKECPRCQARVQQLGLKDDNKHKKEFYLQSYLTERIEKFVNAHGRQIIGWDEILEGKLAPNATVMSWRGSQGGKEAAELGHDVIMSPNTHCYFDHYQAADRSTEPLAIGGYLPLEKVYQFEPIPTSLSAEEAKHILGAQANLWTEYIPTPQQAEYMLLPRMAAITEVQWTNPSLKKFLDFQQRLIGLMKIYDLLGYNYATHIFDVNLQKTTNRDDNTIDITLTTLDNSPIYYTLDGTSPSLTSLKYSGTPIKIDKTTTLKAQAIRTDNKNSKLLALNFNFNKATLKPIKLLTTPSPNFAGDGASTLNDGVVGVDDNYSNGEWLGFHEENLIAVVDMLSPTEISQASINTCVNTADWVFDMKKFKIEVSNDGENFREITTLTIDETKYPTHHKSLNNYTLSFPKTSAQYVKITVIPIGELPQWHGGKGTAFVFVDEIAIN